MLGIVFKDDPRQGQPERLGTSARTLYDVGCFEGEVINGGFSQFFSNSSGDCADESLAALRTMVRILMRGSAREGTDALPEAASPR